MSDIITISGVTKIYDNPRTKQRKEALKGVNLSIPRGSFFGLLGPNGAGKSTLINIIADLTRKTSGTITIDGIDIDQDRQAAKHHIGIVPQEVILDPFFNVYEMLEYHAGYYGVPKSERRTDEILEALALSDKKHLNSRRLSGGMKRRVLIAKALVHNPPVLILDEPTAGVDVELRIKLWEYVKQLNEAGTTILLTTHYLEEAEELCDEIAVINHGNIVACDSKDNLIKMMDNKCLTIRCRESLSEVPKALQAFDTSITDEHSLLIQYHANDVMMGDILKALQKSKLDITDLSTEEPDLEDIFRHLTHETLEKAA